MPLLSAITTIASLIFRSRDRKMLRKMYLVSPDYLNKNKRPSQFSTSLPKSIKPQKSSLKNQHSTKHTTRVIKKKSLHPYKWIATSPCKRIAPREN